MDDGGDEIWCPGIRHSDPMAILEGDGAVRPRSNEAHGLCFGTRIFLAPVPYGTESHPQNRALTTSSDLGAVPLIRQYLAVFERL
jgi:hypothetical protein